MYIKPPRKQIPSGAFVPENYHGTAFTQEQEVQHLQEETALAQQEEQTEVQGAIPAAKKQESGPLSALFSGFSDLRSDDILLLALMLLLLRSDGGGKGTSEILPLLAILLFMG